jgi:hypothetical protein
MAAQAIKSKLIAKKPRAGKKVDAATALKLRVDNQLTYTQIANIQGVSKQAIHKSIAHLLPTEDTKTYKERRADVFAKLQLDILSTIDSAAIKDSSLLQRVTSASILYDKERLETGKSSANIAVLIGKIEAMQDE